LWSAVGLHAVPIRTRLATNVARIQL
jgi:hypothetical protein